MLKGPEHTEIHDQLELFGQYTIEALIVHVLGVLFNSNKNKADDESMIRTATLISKLDSYVRNHARYLKIIIIIRDLLIRWSMIMMILDKEPDGSDVIIYDGNMVSGNSDHGNTVSVKDNDSNTSSGGKVKKGKKDREKRYLIGTNLVSFMIERELIVLIDAKNNHHQVIKDKKEKKKVLLIIKSILHLLYVIFAFLSFL